MSYFFFLESKLEDFLNKWETSIFKCKGHGDETENPLFHKALGYGSGSMKLCNHISTVTFEAVSVVLTSSP